MNFIKDPIILFCSERSGSNLLTKMMDANPSFCGPGASHLFRLVSEFSCKVEPNIDRLKGLVIQVFLAKASFWKIDEKGESYFHRILEGCRTADEMAASLYLTEMHAHRKEVIVIKENAAYSFVDLIFRNSVNPRVLFLVRDPRDMALSWKEAPLIRGGVLRATETWLSDQEGFIKNIALLPDSVPFSFLRYEDLIAQPEVELKRICKDLGFSYDPEMVHFNEVSSSASIDAGLSPLWRNLQKPVLANNSGKYLSGLSDDEIAYVELKCDKLMHSFGYKRSRRDKPEYGRFDSERELLKSLEAVEPYDKPDYQEIDFSVRRRFEAWNELYDALSEKPYRRFT